MHINCIIMFEIEIRTFSSRSSFSLSISGPQLTSSYFDFCIVITAVKLLSSIVGNIWAISLTTCLPQVWADSWKVVFRTKHGWNMVDFSDVMFKDQQLIKGCDV